jgi:predicted Zn-dependent protease
MSPRIRRSGVLLFVATLLHAQVAAAGSVTPFLMPPDKNSLMADEDRVWSMSDELDRAIRRKGAVLDQPELNAYLQRVMDRLYPEFVGTLAVKAIDDPTVNAFCMANGKVYIHLGMLARVQNESQLATVLAHEGAHFVYRHSYQNMQSAHSGSAIMLTATILFGGIGQLLGGLVGVSSIAGFSRDLEREADRIGFQRLSKAGYDVREAPKAFDALAALAKIEDKSPPYMFASHPRLQERIESFQELVLKVSEVDAAPAEPDKAFAANVIPLREAWLKRELGIARNKYVIYLLTQDSAAAEWPRHYAFYLGEAYRMRGEKDDADKALDAYRAAIEASPEYAPSYRALGMLLYKRKDSEAADTLRKYLALALDAADRPFIEQLIENQK